jgi:hypothetical protein
MIVVIWWQSIVFPTAMGWLLGMFHGGGSKWNQFAVRDPREFAPVRARCWIKCNDHIVIIWNHCCPDPSETPFACNQVADKL